MKKAKKLTVILTVLGICMLSGAGILGYWKMTGNSGNILTMASFQNQIEEEYRIPDKVDPGQTIDKVVNVKNTGTADSRIRVKLRKMFGERTKNGSFLEDPELDPEMILIQCNDRYWKQMQDGYYYYTEILKAGNRTKEPLFESYTLDKMAGNEYRKKEARIVVTMEAVQAQDVAEEIWGVSDGELGITRPENEKAEATEVIYLGQRGGFQMTESDTDLFASFKNLTPGCARTQIIELENKSSEEIQLYLRAEAATQKSMDADTARLVRELLEKHAIIEITGSQGTLYQGPVSGNLKGNGNTMKEDLYLGTWKAGQKKKMQVKLALSEEMDNEFCKLTGKVRWVFTAKGEDEKTVTSVYAPSTGDNTETGMWIALLGFSAFFLAAAFAVERSYSRREEHEADKRDS